MSHGTSGLMAWFRMAKPLCPVVTGRGYRGFIVAPHRQDRRFRCKGASLRLSARRSLRTTCRSPNRPAARFPFRRTERLRPRRLLRPGNAGVFAAGGGRPASRPQQVSRAPERSHSLASFASMGRIVAEILRGALGSDRRLEASAWIEFTTAAAARARAHGAGFNARPRCRRSASSSVRLNSSWGSKQPRRAPSRPARSSRASASTSVAAAVRR
jgi:hypothetical protein